MATSATETVGLAVIARDEERTLPTLLDTASGCFDEVALVDTGSTDSTVAEFKAWVAAEARRQPSFKGRLGRFDWCDDFAAARNAADALLGTAWRVWADADDEIRGARHLRRLAATAPPHIAAFTATYETARTPTGEALSRSQRIRMARAGAATWRGTVHEHLVVEGELRSRRRQRSGSTASQTSGRAATAGATSGSSSAGSSGSPTIPGRSHTPAAKRQPAETTSARRRTSGVSSRARPDGTQSAPRFTASWRCR
jgi:hypothetical protein